ncbi:hypothetical protein CTI12_AA558170 [Artemisia annua]|uniref:Cation-transporting P-type ATPase N-terminal domain-containing protein n=1 Tax=Artemisia annua TaxID=35608 RepID=A0A2U1KVS2_ARTAN|nr:hypothetical protein CTI12_AA558170 [Artemisia annua]
MTGTVKCTLARNGVKMPSVSISGFICEMSFQVTCCRGYKHVTLIANMQAFSRKSSSWRVWSGIAKDRRKGVADEEHMPMDELFDQLKCKKEGLASEEGKRRLGIFSPNKESKILRFLGFMWNPLSWVMEAAAIMAICLANGGGKPPDWQDFVGITTLLIINSIFWYSNMPSLSSPLVLILGLLSVGAGIAAEFTRAKASETYIDDYQCGNSLTMGLAITGAVALALLRIVVRVATGRGYGCCRTLPHVPKLIRYCIILAWLMSFLAVGQFISGAKLCNPKPGLFSTAAFEALTSLCLTLFYYLVIASSQNEPTKPPGSELEAPSISVVNDNSTQPLPPQMQ